MALPLRPQGTINFSADSYSLQSLFNGGSVCLCAKGVSGTFEEIVIDLHRRSLDHMYRVPQLAVHMHSRRPQITPAFEWGSSWLPVLQHAPSVGA